MRVPNDKRSEGSDQGPDTEADNSSIVAMKTRPPMETWDRLKILIVLGVIFVFLTAGATSQNPLMSFGAALRHEVNTAWWLVALVGIELIRQIHYLISEHSPEWNTFFSEVLFKNPSNSKMDDWTKYRLGRAARIASVVVILDLILAAHYHLSVFTAIFQAPAALYSSLPLLAQLAFAFFFVIIQFAGLFWFLSKGGIDVYFPGDVKTRFSDVWGQDAVLERVKENIIFLKDPDSIEDRGGYVPGGILLWGPPGTGKTLMAEAVAGETENPFVFVDPGAFINMFMGIGVLKVKGLFRKLRKLAVRYGGVVVFFDEADSLGSRGTMSGVGGNGANTHSFNEHALSCNGLNYLTPSTSAQILKSYQEQNVDPETEARGGRFSRFVAGAGGMGGMGGNGGGGTLQALLTELSGLKKPRGFFNRTVRRALGLKPKDPPKYRMLVMMATNMPESLDEALLRPGRIDRIYRVGYPSKLGRIRTYKGYLDKVQHCLTEDEIDRLATITPYATGATIKDLVNESLIISIRDGRDIITWRDIVRAKQLKEYGPPDDVEYIERERHAVAVHEACHAVVASKIRQHLTIDLATIEKGSNFLGLVASIPPEDQFTRWRSEYEADIMVSLASLVGERMFFDGDNSSGVSGDLEAATTVATLMEGYWGMGSTLSSHSITQKSGTGASRPTGRGPTNKKRDGKDIPDMLGDRIEAKLDELYRRVRNVIEDSRDKVFAVAHALEAYKTVSGEDITAIIEGRKGPLIDGSVYADPVFIEALERYHSAVLAAHRDHRSVDAQLPMPTVAAPVISVDAALVTSELVLGGATQMSTLDDQK